MTLDEVTKTAIEPALALLPRDMDTPEARVIMLAICLQESECEYRVQKGNGPAHGLWQFEAAGGCKGVVNHPASAPHMQALCAARSVYFGASSIWHALVTDDVLAAGAARLLLFTDPAPLPGLWHGTSAWSYYERNWRPGKPRPADWIPNYAAALKYVGY